MGKHVARALISMYLQHIGPISGMLTPLHSSVEVPIVKDNHRLCAITQHEGDVFWFDGGELGVYEHFPKRKVRRLESGTLRATRWAMYPGTRGPRTFTALPANALPASTV